MLVEGPRACGKTATASRLARTIIRFDEDPDARAAVSVAPQTLFENPTPILFDEWQLEPAIWNRVRREVDDRQAKGLVLLTGSSTPRPSSDRHSGAGRIGVVRMRPMSLYESGHSSGRISLTDLFDEAAPSAGGVDTDVPVLMERIIVGGWPALLDATEADARDYLTDYLTQIVDVDIPLLGSRRDPRNLRRLLTALGRSTGQAVKLSELAADVGGEAGPIAHETLLRYLEALERLGLTDDSEAWQPHMRSRARLRVAPVRYFVDPSIAAAALGIGSRDLLRDLNAAGFHFESLALRDLRVYAQPIGGVISSWRDSNGNEVDAVVTLNDGRWGAFEVKLNPTAIDTAAANLKRFASTIDAERHGAPSVLGVITSTGYAYRRPDGVQVIPITAFGP
ncbi:ATP-binding protein [Agromyces italicus]|uniref:ATP-binding protein n=1 Tax=Agromyces italicus TaxID=279572 RepID=UPI001FE17930|nr:DUF4143 domain-containing protein [Agromyces italicus]